MRLLNSRIKRWSILLVVLLAIAAMIATTVVVAKYQKKTDEVKNSFLPAVTEMPPIVEDFDHVVKKDVSFKVNKDNSPTEYPVYFRVAIVVTWKNAEEIVYYIPPVKGTDYRLDLKLDPESKWVEKNDGYYYYTIPVASDGQTDVLIKLCEQLSTAEPPAGYTLSVDVIVQTVQAVGYTDDDRYEAWEDAWARKDTAPEGTTTVTPTPDEPDVNP